MHLSMPLSQISIAVCKRQIEALNQLASTDEATIGMHHSTIPTNRIHQSEP
jgi:hypothetical protein